jgi:DnaJ-class molecular chaperone
MLTCPKCNGEKKYPVPGNENTGAREICSECSGTGEVVGEKIHVTPPEVAQEQTEVPQN